MVIIHLLQRDVWWQERKRRGCLNYFVSDSLFSHFPLTVKSQLIVEYDSNLLLLLSQEKEERKEEFKVRMSQNSLLLTLNAIDKEREGTHEKGFETDADPPSSEVWQDMRLFLFKHLSFCVASSHSSPSVPLTVLWNLCRPPRVKHRGEKETHTE